MTVEYESICEKLMHDCLKMEDTAAIKAGYEALKDFSEDDILFKCDLAVGECIRAHAILRMLGEYFEAKGRERASIKEDIMYAARDFFDY